METVGQFVHCPALAAVLGWCASAGTTWTTLYPRALSSLQQGHGERGLFLMSAA
jgi:hypothetical protein